MFLCGLHHIVFHLRRSLVDLRAPVVVLLLVFLPGCSEQPSAAPAAPLDSAEALIVKGNQKSRMCMGCHGPRGVSRVLSYPSLAGLSETHLVEQLHAFRNGERENPMMSSIVMSLGDEDILALAAYYASQPSPGQPSSTQPSDQSSTQTSTEPPAPSTPPAEEQP